MPVAITGISHLRLTVTEIGRARAFYEEVFGLPVLAEAPPPDASQDDRDRAWWLFGGVVYALPGGTTLGLRPAADAGDRFDSDRVGLDHLSFAVAGQRELQDAVAVLDARGVAHDGVVDTGEAWILTFRDPDGNALELTAPR